MYMYMYMYMYMCKQHDPPTSTRSLTEFGRRPAVVVELLRGGRGLI